MSHKLNWSASWISCGGMLCALFLALETSAAELAPDAARKSPALTNIQQVLDLGPYRARLLQQAVHLRGTVVGAMKNQAWLFVHDGTGSILVYGTNRPAELNLGQVVEVDGVTETGLQAPMLIRAGVRVTGSGPLPEPMRMPVSRLLAGEGCWQYVRIEGVVRDLNRDAWNVALSVASSGNRFTVTLMDYWRFKRTGLPLDWLETRVMIDGVCWTDVNDRNQDTSFHLILSHTNQIQFLTRGNTNLFAMPPLKKEQAKRLHEASDVRVKLTGTVVAQFPDGRMFLSTDFGAVEARLDPFISRGMPNTELVHREPVAPMQTGDEVELIGAPVESLFAPHLVDVECRSVGHRGAPHPVKVEAEDLASGAHDAQLVSLTAQLLAHERRSVDGEVVDSLVLKSHEAVFEATWRTSSSNGLPAFPLNARLRVNGICLTRAGPANVRRTFEILLRSPSDIAYLGQAPFWSNWPLRRFLMSGLALAVAASVWIYLLRRRVRQRTAELVRVNEQLRQNGTRLHESETLFRTAFDASPAMVSLVRAADQKMITVNEALCRQSEYTREELVGRTLSEMRFWTSAEQQEAFTRTLQEKGKIRDQEMVFRSKTGRLEIILLSADVIQVAGEPHILTVAVDITARKQAEEEIQRALAQERELSRLKSHFVNTVSHEFRTPLGVIMSSAENLRDYSERFSPEKRAEHLRDIFDATRTMSGLMEEVLLLGKMEAGKVLFRPEPLDLPALCKGFIEEVRMATDSERQIELKCETTDRLARGDEGLLRHILVNLLSNAVKYSPAGSLVELRVEQREAFAVFTIRDHGIGIPAEDVPHLFESFYRGRNVGDTPGSGLGLVIVKRCAELHGGTIEYLGRAGDGSMFVARLPLFMKLV